MKLRKFFSCVATLAALTGLGLEGCGGGSANVVTVAMSQTTAALVVTQVLNLSATVSGSTNLNVTWTCTFTTTTTTIATNNTTTSTTSAAAPCTADTGVLTNVQSTTVTYTAPSKIKTPPPTATTIVSPPTVTITATAAASSKATATCVVALDSGISVTVNPATAAIPTNQKFQFVATLTNDPVPNDVAWQLTQEPLSAANSLADLVTCSPGCGSISSTGVYTGPSTVPTAATPSTISTTTPQVATVLAISNVDSTRLGIASVTIVPTGTITFSGIAPAVAPQGGVLQDVFLQATNVNSLTSIFFDGTALPSSQVVVISPPVLGSTPNGARARLLPDQLVKGGTHTISICNPPIGQTTCTPDSSGGPFNITVQSERPALISTSPDSLPQSAPGTPSAGSLVIDGGFFGSTNFPLVSAQFNGTPLAVSQPSSRQLGLTMPALPTAGLFPISVTNNTASPNTAVTSLAVFPDYNGSNQPSAAALLPLTGTATPSAIAIDDVLGVAAVTEVGTNKVEFINLNGGNPLVMPSPVSVGTTPTGVAMDTVGVTVGGVPGTHVTAVVNYADRTVELLRTPAPGGPINATPVATINLAPLIPTTAPTTPPTPPPFPFSIGIDPFTHTAIIAYSNTNIGFIADIDPGNAAKTSECLISGQHPPCVISSVSLGTGQYPQVALQPRVHLAYVTPGGAGPLTAVDLTKKSTIVGIASAIRTSNVVTVTTTAAHNINPANPGTVLISGVSTTNTNFNGTFSQITVIDANNFAYSQTAVNDSVTGGTAAAPIGTVSYGNAFLLFSVSQTLQGIAINPISRAAVIADPQSNLAQVTFLNTLDQSLAAVSLNQGVILGGTNTGAPGEIGDSAVAYQPYSNTAVVFNPHLNQLSLLDPARLARIQLLPTNGTGIGTVNVPSGGSTPNALAIPGALAVDATNNVALAVNSGSNNISVVHLGTIKAVEITSVVASSSVPGAILPQAVLTTNSTPTAGGAVTVQIFGTGFTSGSPATVRLDGTPLTGVTVVNNNEIDASVPTSFLTVPRRYALDVIVGGVGSNPTDFSVVQAVSLQPSCTGSTAPAPSAVAIDTTRNIAVVSNNGCGSISVVDLTPGATSPLKKTIAVGTSPSGIDVIPRLGYAVVANNGDGTASIVNLNTDTVISSPSTGTNPTGVAINQYSGLAIIANTGSNSISSIDLTSITASTTTPTVNTLGIDQQPIAVAIDPNRAACGTGSTTGGVGIAVVTALELGSASSAAIGVLDTVDISSAAPAQCTTVTVATVTATPTGIVFDPAGGGVTTNSNGSTSQPPGIFYATGSQGNSIFAFNPSTGVATPASVGINPTSLSVNPNTGTLLTVNSLSNTISVLDTQTLSTRATMGVSGSTQFASAIHPLTNMAVVTDSANNRLLILPLPN
ncbi:MAG TPA: YncE family protein [Candidatus Acidoferrum sp.]|jgi:DNA-binding beta-propeller fold protein YncE|nr:YncE family protein [Candidatus Acidoferrum sp.]